MQIVITHFENPHRFWYKQFGGGPQRQYNRQFQANLHDYCDKHYSALVEKTSARYEPVLREIVAGLDPIQRKWFRCRVDGISDDGSGVPQMRLWAIDEGMPLNAVYVMALPEKFSSKPTTVRCGGVKNILPATHLFDAHEGRLNKGFSPTWDKYVIGVFKTFLEGAHQILLDNIVTHTVGREEVSFGELYVVTPKRTVSAHSILLEIGLALQADPKSCMIFMTEHHGSETSYCSSEVNESIVQPSASLNVIKTESLGKQMNTIGNEVNENDFDESASMIGTLKPKNKIPFLPASCVVHYPEPVKQKTAERNQKEQQTLQKAHNAEEGCANDGLPVNFDPSLHSNGSLKLNEQQLNFISTIGSANSNTVDLNALPISTMIDTGPVPEAVSDPVGKPKSKLRSRMENMKNMKKMKKTSQTNETNGKPQTTNSTATNPQQTQPNQNDPPPTVRQTKEVASAQNKPKSNQKAAATPTAQQTVPKAHDQPINVRVAKPNKRFEKVVDEEQWVLSRLKYHRLLVHGKCATKPIDAIENANFCSYVHRQLQLLPFTTLYRLQAYAWPNIMRGNSLVCVNGPKTGKTFAYIPAVCSVVKNLIEEKLTPACAGPVGIIICHSSREVQRVAFYCRTMLNTEVNHHLAVHDCYARRSVEKTAMLLLNSCALLVTTAACYQELYESMKEAFSRERIKVVVIDDLEEILQHSNSALKLLLTKNNNPDLQMIITTCLWNPILASFVQRYTNMVVCIGAYIEAAVYAGVQFRLHVQHHNQKPVELIRYLKQYDYCRERTIVVGKDDGDLDEIVEAATQNSINHLVCNEHTMASKLGGFTSWDSDLPGHMVLLITTDSLLGDLKVSKAQHIIHYSLPESWSTFTRRFATSFGYYDRDQQEAANMAANTLPRTLVLLDEDNNQQLPKLVNFLELHKVPIPPQIAGVSQKIRSFFEHSKAADGTALFALCQQTLQFGRCRNIRDCRNRHTFTIDDLAGKELPSVGSLVKLKVLYIFSPAHYSARLEAQRNPTESDWHVVNDYKVFQGYDIAMQMYYANEDRHEMHGALVIHDLCAVFYEHNYWRCKICSFQLGKDPSVVHSVLLRMIDTGRMVEMKPSLLLHLPEKFRKMPGQAIDIQIAGLTPCDGGQDWDKKATLTVQNWVTDYAYRETFHVEGRVLLTLKGIIWVDEMRLVEQLGSLKTAVTKTKFKASIISKKFGVGNDESFQKLQTHVSSIRPPSIEAPTVVESTKEPEHCARSSSLNGSFEVIQKSRPVEKHSGTLVSSIRPPSIEAPTVVESTKEPEHCARSSSLNGSFEVIQKSRPVEKHSGTLVSSIRPPSIEAPTIVESIKEPEHCARSSSSNGSFEVIAPSSSRPFEKHEFSALEQGNCYNVAVANYYAPDNFYLYRYDHFSDVFNAIESYTANRNNLTPLRNPAVGDYCLACDDDSTDFKRAQVTSVSEERMYLLDFGCELQWNKEDLFELPAPLLQCAPFCAIKAKLAHLHPKWNDCWTEETSLAVYDEVLDKYSSAGSLHAIVVRPMEDPKLTMPGQHCYEVLLTDDSSNDPYLIITEIVAEKGLARYHEDGTATENSTMLEDAGDNDSPSMQCNFTQEELSALLKQLMQDPSSSEKQATKQKDSESSISHSSASSTNNVPALKTKSRFYQRLLDKKKGRNKSRSSADRRIILPRLQCDYRCPQTVWKQDDQFVTLRVSAPDVSRYDLTVDMDSLLLQFMVNDDDRYLLAVNLFQPIDPQRTHHDIRGLTIVLRLAKLIPGIRWHTLLNHPAKLPWLRSALEDNDGTESASGEEEGQGHWNNLLPVELDDPADSNSWSGETDDNEGEFDNVTEDDVFFKV